MSDNTNFQPVFDYIDKNNTKLVGLFEARLAQSSEELLEKLQGKFATKSDIDSIIEKLDDLVAMTRKLDQERLLTIEWIKRIENEVEKIKKHLQIV
ncbi:MAG: hypothetical protein COT92_03525 [Candidatus Doudnabacteria bacterium CG10_big_fil_rev_8_21_14_0_10_42_18]|uniref:Uncharacterized protein n=1 Tax=Candidatus Doudnabacteria bacterium CG10_big_fil_rev_8_21_14_0_10_42_18 TaxID=1974552 RepID=A0A2H0VA75_9BACT|nr:MAG: hypothetical protein COT92_03525 [Candidatus Doudnabacteria bacterium CG10_big_fil_rev_8_21_14_0_10_42_18]